MSVSAFSLFKEKGKRSKTISFKVPEELDEIIEDIARLLNCKKSDVIRESILYYIKHNNKVKSVLSKRYIELLEALTGGRGTGYPQTRTHKSDSNHYMRNTTKNTYNDVYSNPRVETIKILPY